MSYNIKAFKDDILCDVSPLEVCEVLLGKPYMWKINDIYESCPSSFIVTLIGQLYNMLEIVPNSEILLILAK